MCVSSSYVWMNNKNNINISLKIQILNWVRTCPVIHFPTGNFPIIPPISDRSLGCPISVIHSHPGYMDIFKCWWCPINEWNLMRRADKMSEKRKNLIKNKYERIAWNNFWSIKLKIFLLLSEIAAKSSWWLKNRKMVIKKSIQNYYR